LGSIIIGKVVLYYLHDLVKMGMKYFSGKPKLKEVVKTVLDSMANNKKVADDISKMIDPKKGIDNTTAEKIVKMGYVQNSIEKTIGKDNDELDKKELENELKTIISKSWNDLSDKAVDKVKNDLKK
jgi:hypothetical protein